MAGLRLPIESHPLQAIVSEPVKPILHSVVMSNSVHAYVSQSDKGELVIGAGIDGYVSYSPHGGFQIIEDILKAIVHVFPMFSRLRLLRQWAGAGLYVNGGWGTGGFKSTPGSGHVYAHTIARGEPHPLNAPFNLERFSTGALVDEHGAAAVSH
jgi:sarcosine oxidase subunit beta